MEHDDDSAAARFRRVAGRFGERVAEVTEEAWSNPAPPEGWTARDVVRHLVTWVPSVLSRADIAFPGGPSVDDDPVGAWAAFTEPIQAALDDPEVAARTYDFGPPGQLAVADAVDRLVTGDVLVHTWDLARAAGLDDSIDEGIAAEMLEGMRHIDALLRSSGHYGPAVAVPDDADVVTALIAFTGRDPFARPDPASGA